jgi:hypothetical protein
MIHSDFEFEFNGQQGRIEPGQILRVMSMIESSALTAMQVFGWSADPLRAQIGAIAKGVEILCAQARVTGVKQADIVGLLLSKPGHLNDCLNLLAGFMSTLIPAGDDSGNAPTTPPEKPKKTTRKAS